MDKIKGMAQKAMNKGSSSSSNQPAQTGGASGGSEDYVDKGLDAIEKKTGHSMSREQNEAMTDTGRDFFEKQTGKKVPEKFSN